MLRRSSTLVLALLLPASALAACSGGGGGDELVIYSGRTENLVGPLLDRFAEETGTDIAVKYDDSANLAVLLETEGDRSPADVFLSQSPGALGFVDAAELLQALPAETLEKVDERFRASDGDWVGLSGRVRSLAYNTDDVDPTDLPGSVLDLTDPAYEGEVGIAPTNASFQDFVTGMRDQLGDERTLAWLEAMRNNGAVTYPNNTAIVEAIGRGEVSYGLVNHYYAEQARAEDPDLAVANHFFDGGDPGSLILLAGAGVLATADDPGAAQELVDFLLSEEAQRYFAEETFEYPLAASVEPAADLPPIAEIESPPVDFSQLGGGLEATRELIRDSGLESS